MTMKEREIDVLMFEAERRQAEKEQVRKKHCALKRKLFLKKALSFIHLDRFLKLS
jgi:hypothetical protein